MSFRSATSNRTQRSGLNHTNGSVRDGQQQIRGFSDFLPPSATHQDIRGHDVVEEDFPDEDFDDLPLDELDNVMFEDDENVPGPKSTFQNSNRKNTNMDTNSRSAELIPNTTSGFGSRTGSTSSKPIIQNREHQGSSSSFCSSTVVNTRSPLLEEDMDCFIHDVQTNGVETRTSVEAEPARDKESNTSRAGTPGFTSRLFNKPATSVTSEQNPHSGKSVPALTLTTPPFIYLCLLKDLMSKPQSRPAEIQVKAFIVTLLGKLGSTNGAWSVFATISDGTGYLDVELSDGVLTGLLGFSVAEKGALKRDPARRGELEAGMRRCQEALVDMCCIMTIVLGQDGRKAVVAKADPVSERALQQLEQRAKDRRK